MAAQFVTPEAINFMATHGRGLICVTLTEEQVERLKLPMMQSPGRSGPALGTAFTVSIEARHGVTTGISAADRAHTIRVAANPEAQAGGPRHARPRLPAPRAQGRRARAHGPDRGLGRPRAPRRPHARRRHLRDHERRRHDGADAGPRAVRREARPPHPDDRGPHPVPPLHRAPRAAGRPRRRSRSTRRAPSGARSSTRRRSTTGSSSRS